ncbi:hypothetical protein KI387_000072, partial [Taxus chinensis]
MNHDEQSPQHVDESFPQGNISPTHSEVMRSQSSALPPQKGRARWSITDTLVLIAAKHIERETQSNGGAMKKAISSSEKWKIVQKYCVAHGLNRTPNQCRDRWEHIQPDFKKIRDYEANIPSGHDSYWTMTVQERNDKKLPPKYPEEVFHSMEVNFGQDRAINPGNITIDSSDPNHMADEVSTPNENEKYYESQTPKEVAETQSTGKKRKAISKATGLKDTLVENNKSVITTLQMAEEGRMKRHEKDCSMLEQRMQMENANEERLIKIEEQKINVQVNLVSALNSIGQAMIKI